MSWLLHFTPSSLRMRLGREETINQICLKEGGGHSDMDTQKDTRAGVGGVALQPRGLQDVPGVGFSVSALSMLGAGSRLWQGCSVHGARYSRMPGL